MTGDDRLGFARTVDDWLRSLAARNLRPRSVDAYRRILYAAIDLIGEQRDPRTLTIDDYELCLATWAAHVEPNTLHVVRALLDDGRDVTITLSFAASEFAAAIQAAPAAEAAGAAA